MGKILSNKSNLLAAGVTGLVVAGLAYAGGSSSTIVPNGSSTTGGGGTLATTYSSGTSAADNKLSLNSTGGAIEIDVGDIRKASPSPAPNNVLGLYLVNPSPASLAQPQQFSPPVMFQGGYYDPGSLTAKIAYAWEQLQPDGTLAAPNVISWDFYTDGFPTRSATLSSGNISDPNNPTGVFTAGDIQATDAFFICTGANTQCKVQGTKQNVWLDATTGTNTFARGNFGLGAAALFVGDDHLRVYLGGTDPVTQIVMDMRSGHTEVFSFQDDGNSVWSIATTTDRSGAYSKGLFEVATFNKDRFKVNAGPYDAVTVLGNFDDTVGQLVGPLIIKGTHESIGGGSGYFIGVTLDDTIETGGKNWTMISKTNVAMRNYTDGNYAWFAFPSGDLKVGPIASFTDNGFALETEGAVKFDGDITVGAFEHLGSIAFASLGTPANGTLIYCSNCTVANPCASGGTGAFAKRINGAWVCN